MRTIAFATRFKRDYRREAKSYLELDVTFAAVVELLSTDSELPARLQDHPLAGDWKGCRDCHLRPDLILIYEKPDPKRLTLLRLGSHSELFG